MNLIDTHTHIYSDAFESDREAMIQRAYDQKISHLFVPAIDSTYFDEMTKVKEKYPDFVYLMMGLHPCSVKKETYKDELQFVYQQLLTNKYVAVGEIGVDLYWDKTTLAFQQQAFQQQIQWAKQFDLPINIHSREAFEETFEVLEQEKDKKVSGIFHCFTGSIHDAHRAIDLGLKLGIGGVATFKNGKIDQFLNEIPLENIVLETDAPYLAPIPFRGKRNEPSYIIHVAEKLAHIYQLTLEEIAYQTSKNALDVYKKYVKS